MVEDYETKIIKQFILDQKSLSAANCVNKSGEIIAKLFEDENLPEIYNYKSIMADNYYYCTAPCQEFQWNSNQ